MFQRAEKERTKTSFFPIGARVGAVIDQVCEKTLGQILRVLRSISLLAQESVQWAPVNLAQFRERTECVSGSRLRIARSEDNRPTRRCEQFIATFRFAQRNPRFHNVNENKTNGIPGARNNLR